ncbi:hypothetical protein [Streptomyces sp. NPDC021562]|uniref:hypothetical protein n=1 Tax=Streptomyces sp. NPDC021562 TaxID=3155121 RepID=UPI00104C7A49
MRARLRLTREGDAFVARVTPAQAEAFHRALTFLRARVPGDAALVVRLGAGPATVDALAGRFAHRPETSFELRLSLAELHVLHSAMTASAVVLLERGMFSEEAFHRELAFYRENFDALAQGIAEAVAEA